MAARGAYATGLARREAILRAASEAFATHGYRGASLAMIAERVGMSAPGLLHHFPTKEHLLIDLLALRQERDAARVRALASERGGRILDALLVLANEERREPRAGQAVHDARRGERRRRPSRATTGSSSATGGRGSSSRNG